jgi:hypothetical protein
MCSVQSASLCCDGCAAVSSLFLACVCPDPTILLYPAVNLPGAFYSISTDGQTIDQQDCPANSYGAGLKKQRACVPCPTGYSTMGATAKTAATDCGECAPAHNCSTTSHPSCTPTASMPHHNHVTIPWPAL